MRITWDHELDGLRSWGDLEHHLSDEWREVRVGRTGLTLSRHLDELLVDEPASGTAAQRRALHRAGFRRREERCWGWAPPEPCDLPPAPASFTPAMASAWRYGQRGFALDTALRAQVLLVLREIYRAVPAELVVTVAEDEDEWDDDDEDDDWPALDCAALEALYGARRGTS